MQDTLGTDTEAAITDLRARVKAMRELGVVKFGDIELGPLPAKAEPRDDEETQRSDRLEAEKQRVARIRFAASGGPRPVGDKR